jgi:hypothetical protein
LPQRRSPRKMRQSTGPGPQHRSRQAHNFSKFRTCLILPSGLSFLHRDAGLFEIFGSWNLLKRVKFSDRHIPPFPVPGTASPAIQAVHRQLRRSSTIAIKLAQQFLHIPGYWGQANFSSRGKLVAVVDPGVAPVAGENEVGRPKSLPRDRTRGCVMADGGRRCRHRGPRQPTNRQPRRRARTWSLHETCGRQPFTTPSSLG